MYTIIGVDGIEYGPVTADQVRAWVANGRADRNTRCRAAGEFEWKTVADFPELTAVPAVGAGTPPERAAMAYAAPGGSVPAEPKLDIARCYERGWSLLKANFWPFVGVTLIIWILTGGILGVQWALHSRRGGFLLSVLLNPLLVGGLNNYFLLKVRGKGSPGLTDFFSGLGKHYLVLLGIHVLVMIFVTFGLFFLFIPGIFLAVAYYFSTLVAIDRNTGVWESMEASRKMVLGNWWRLFGLLLMMIPFVVIGALCLIVGLLVVGPLCIGAAFYAYEDLNGRVPAAPTISPLS